ncbi:MAG: ABC transporter ATP-binding protein [Polyangiaceae bacterium]|nr:ABC transporter ATP-binding protein [Polyangiaceae bacterium]
MPSDPLDPATVPVGLGAQVLRHRARYLLGAALLGAYQYSQYWFDTRSQRAVDALVGGQTAAALAIGPWLVGVAVGAFGIRVWSRIAVFNAGRQAEYELRQALLGRLQRLGPSFFGRMASGEIMSRATNDLLQIRLLLGFGMLNVINTVFGLVSALAVTLSYSIKLTAASLATLPALLLVTRHFSRLMFSRTRENQDALGRMSDAAQTSIAGVRVVRSFALEEQELARFERTNRDYLEKNLALARLRLSMGPVLQMVTAAGVLIVFWYGGHLLFRGELTEGEFLFFYRALGRLTWPLMALGFVVGLVQRGRAAYRRLAEVYESEPDVVDGPLPEPEPRRVTGGLEVRELSFGYGDHPVLRGVSLRVPPGGSLAIVGRTGAGKSTLAALLPRLQPTPRGAVFLDGVDICDLPLAFVRRTIGYAQQTPFLFSTTLARNVGYALDDPDSPEGMARVERAAAEAHLTSDLAQLPDGLDTIVGERGVQLSGGQKQRAALARAFVREPRILVLDDPLSAVDARTETAILAAIDRQRAERSVILVTHRVAAAARCDRIVVLDAGSVLEEGTHDELVARGGLYAMFAEEQRIESELARLGDVSGAPATGATA